MSSQFRPIRRVLVANRGEIAVRVMRTCRERGIETVAVYSDVDRLAPHVQVADYAVAIGPAPASQSYLVIDKIIAACKQSGADAVHPGYGFLSENEDFADACTAEGITFIGPSAEAMRKMGSKTEARKTVSAAGTPVVPGDNGPTGDGFPDAEMALVAATKIGFPVLIKAAAGGGGKGMRLVTAAAELTAAFEGARREATSAFGDGTVYLERAIIRPRHIEIQVFGDTQGNIVHLGERDCSIQRRHQKLLEEAPSPVISPEQRAHMGGIVSKAMADMGYRGAGTIEFLYEGGEFYFIEMNTRLQVEHPVTEMISGLDLVREQIRIAQGDGLSCRQDQIVLHGHAIECRINAEDPETFAPSPGTVKNYVAPGGMHVRVDSGLYAGYKVPPYYDSMIGKLIVYGKTRERCIMRLRRALEEYIVEGMKTTIPLHQRIVRDEAFVAGDYTIKWLERWLEEQRDPAD